jgi:hypothetical protein
VNRFARNPTFDIPQNQMAVLPSLVGVRFVPIAELPVTEMLA